MPPAETPGHLLVFGDLLAHLRRRGFSVGVDSHLRLHALLGRVGAHAAPEELRTLLCPLFATSAKQQAQFYAAFDDYFEHFAPAPDDDKDAPPDPRAKPPAAQSPPRKTRRVRPLYALAAAALLLALAAAAYFYFRPVPVEPVTSPPVETTAPVPSLTTVPTVIPTATPTPPPPPPPEESFIRRYALALQLAALLLPLALFLLNEWLRLRRRRLLLRHDREKRPPFSWPVRVGPLAPKLFDSERFYAAARQLRRRQTDEYYRLDVEATVSATIGALGYPTFRYRSASRVPEYLFLIERASHRDHQARLFDELVLALEREGLFVARYFYDDDPRACRDARTGESIHLADLQNRHGSHRLLLFGGGDELIDPVTGRLEDWAAAAFSRWQDRAVLTPEGDARMGLREQELAKLFAVAPADLEGLLALADAFESPAATPRPEAALAHDPAQFDSSPELQAEALRRALGEDAFQWLCACAVYPELQWDLTLYLATLPSMPAGLITETNLLRLARLPWFRRGSMPDGLRWHLIAALDPARARGVRTALVELLERNPAPPQTHAADEYQLNLHAQRWLREGTRRRLRELLRLMKRLPQHVVFRDYILIRFLETARRTPLDFVIPRRLRKLFYRRGLPSLGLRTGARLAAALLVAGLALVAVRAFTLSRPEDPFLGGFARLIPPGWLPSNPDAYPGIDAASDDPEPLDGDGIDEAASAEGDEALPASTVMPSPQASPLASPQPLSSPKQAPPMSVTMPQTRLNMPDLLGLSVRDVARLCAQMGLELEATGEGRAVRQHPAAGTGVEAGQSVKVEFETIPGGARAARLIDEYGDIRLDDEKARLDNFAIELQNDPSARGYLIGYHFRSGSGIPQRRVERAKQYLVRERSIAPDRIMAVDGGYRETLTVQLFVVPWGAAPPAAAPTVPGRDATRLPTARVPAARVPAARVPAETIAPSTGQTPAPSSAPVPVLDDDEPPPPPPPTPPPRKAYTPDGKYFITIDKGALAVTLKDVATGHDVRTFKGHNGVIRDTAVSPDGRLMATSSADRTVKVWDLVNGKLLQAYTLRAEVSGIKFSPDGTFIQARNTYRVAKAASQSTYYFFDLKTGKVSSAEKPKF